MQQTSSPQSPRGDNSDRQLQWKDRSLPYKICFVAFCLCSLLYTVVGFVLPLWVYVERQSTTESLTVSDSSNSTESLTVSDSSNSKSHQQSLVLGLWQACTADFMNCWAINVAEVQYSYFMVVRLLSILAVLMMLSVCASELFCACGLPLHTPPSRHSCWWWVCCFQQKSHICGFGAMFLTMVSVFIYYSKLPFFFPQYGSDKISLNYSFCTIIFNLFPMGFTLLILTICKDPDWEPGTPICTSVAVQLPAEARAENSGEVRQNEFVNRVRSVAPPTYERVMRESGGTLSSRDLPSYEDVEKNLELFRVRSAS